MDILAGFVLCIVVELFLWGAYRMHRRNLAPPPRPQPPRTRAQLANERVYDELQALTPRVVSVAVKRRTVRGRRRIMMEREDETFD